MKKTKYTPIEGRKGYGSLIPMINEGLKRKHNLSKNTPQII